MKYQFPPEAGDVVYVKSSLVVLGSSAVPHVKQGIVETSVRVQASWCSNAMVYESKTSEKLNTKA